MSARDDFGSGAGRPNSGGGGLQNGGIGGGWGSGGGGAGAGRNGGYNSRTGLTTGNTWYGNTAFGPAGGRAMGYAMRDPASLARAGMGPMNGNFSNFKDLNGNAMFGGALSGQSFNAPNAMAAYTAANGAYQAMKNSVQQGPLNRPTRPAPTPVADVLPPQMDWPPVLQHFWNGYNTYWPGQGAVPQNPDWGPPVAHYYSNSIVGGWPGQNSMRPGSYQGKNNAGNPYSYDHQSVNQNGKGNPPDPSTFAGNKPYY